ncbi:putative 16S rRNA-processing protein RimM [Candidatus Ichthyocystis hellenicum]|uniref:Ribosome maturation factor RimM n=1 Tax=Candidatus Ichthyocystis hellenicum TaxID=1561003 RepID=A0A0S4M414_9BURK|nr:ribosome maturation factor RimM [Candidatus Ichthyocystis hellenicum]CUT16888.1 putative 16S rRNA-processing protein RimM [Candidatus Ichthyocystis hellenicum]
MEKRNQLDSSWIPVGRVARPFSIGGWFWLYDYGEVISHLRPGLSCRLEKGLDFFQASFLSCFSCSSRLRVLLEGVSDRTSAEYWVGADFMIRRCDFSPISSGEYYWVDLLNMSVENRQGCVLGTVGRIVRGVVDDFLEVNSSSGQFLIPTRHPFFSSVDFSRSVIVVDWHPDG